MLIVKKMPILQGFPDFETVKNLSGNAADTMEILLISLTFRLVINSMSYQILLRGFLLLTCIKCFAL